MTQAAKRLASQAAPTKAASTKAPSTKAAKNAQPMPAAAALHLPGLDGESAAQLLATANDVTLVLSPSGRILQAWASDPALARDVRAFWVGQEWARVVASEGTEKIAALLLEATTQGKSQRWRQVNHNLPKQAGQAEHGEDTWPVQYSTVAVRAASAGTGTGPPAISYVLACGRDMRPAVQLQRRLVDAQQSMERDYWRFREAETRYRTLFQSSPDAVLIVEGPTYRVLEANPAAEALLATGRRSGGNRAAKPPKPASGMSGEAAASRLVGTPLLTVLGSGAAEQVLGLMAQVHSQGHDAVAPVTVTLAGHGPGAGALVQVAVVLYRQEQVQYWLVRLVQLPPAKQPAPKLAPGGQGHAHARADADADAHAHAHAHAHADADARAGDEVATDAPASTPASTAEALSRAYAQQVGDAVVFTDSQGRILTANAAFAALAQISSAASSQGQPLSRWLGQTGVELGVLLNQLRQGGRVGSFTTQVRGEFGAVAAVELSAVALQTGASQPAGLAFTLRDQGRRPVAEGTHLAGKQPANKLARSPSELNELVGRVPMKDIVSETSDMIEKLCIEAALQMSRDNRALAAQLLGLSRQSLYVKLRRYGLGELGELGDGEAEADDSRAR
jgi:transcriptional regulator PpsR